MAEKQHTHTGPLSETTWVSLYQKGKPVWILLKQETVSGSGISCATIMQVCTKKEIMRFWDAVASAGPYADNLHLAPDRWPHQHLITQFLQAGCPSCRPSNSVKALKAENWQKNRQQVYRLSGRKNETYADRVYTWRCPWWVTGALTLENRRWDR